MSTPGTILDLVSSLHVAQTGEPTNLRRLLAQIAEGARSLVSADLAAVYAVNPVTASSPELRKFVRPPAISGDLIRDDESYFTKSPRPDGLTEEVLSKGSIFISDTDAPNGRASTFTRAEGIRSFAAIALKPAPGDRPLGVVYVDFRSPHQFSSSEQDDLTKYGEIAARVLKSTWYLRRYLEIIRIGQDINQDLSDEKTLFKKLCDHLPGIIDASHAFLLAVNKPETGTLDVYIWEEGEARELLGDPFNGGSRWVIEHRQPLLIEQLSEEGLRLKQMGVELVDLPSSNDAGDARFDEESLVFVPISLRNNVPLGVLSVQHRHPNVYDREDQRLLEALSNHLALALSSIKLFTGLKQLNEAGQLLTRKLKSESILDEIVHQIYLATKSDVVVLYPYSESRRQFDLPPIEFGDYLQPNFPQQTFPRPDDMASLAVRMQKPVFAAKSADLFGLVGGDPVRRKGNFEQREKVESTAAVPLRVGNEAVGVLFVNYRHPQAFEAQQRQFIESLGAFAAIAIRNARLYGELHTRHVRELELLRDIDKRIGSILDETELLHAILELGREHVQAEEASILLYEPAANTLYTAAAVGRHAHYSLSQVISLENDSAIARLVFEREKPIRIDDLSVDEQYKPYHLSVAEDIQSELDVPIVVSDVVIGVINFESTRRGAFTDADQDFLVTLAGQASLAIKNAQVYERERRIANEREALISIGKEISAQLDPTEVFELILEKALDVTECDAGNLMLYDPLRNDLWMAAQKGVVEDKIGRRQQLSEGVVGWVATHRQTLNVDVTLPPWNKTFLHFIPGTCAELAVPLLEGDQLRGVLNIESRAPGIFPEHDVRLLEALASMAVVALQNAERYATATEGKERLKALNEVDKRIIALADNPDAVMQAIVQYSLMLTNGQFGDLSLVVEGKIGTRYFAERQMTGEVGFTDKLVGASAQAMAYGIICQVLKTGQPYHTTTDAQVDPYYTGRDDIHSELAVPLLAVDGSTIGVLNLESTELFAFDHEDVEILQLLAGQAMIAYMLARSFTDVATEQRRISALYATAEIGARMTEASEVSELYQKVGEQLAALNSAEVVIRRFEEATQELVVAYVVQRRANPPFPRIGIDHGINGQVARERRTIVVHDAFTLPEGVKPQFADPETRTAIVTPIVFNDRYYGNLSLMDARPYAFDDADVRLIEGLAQQLALNLYRVEVTEARSQAEQRANAAEVMSGMGQSAFELAHRLGNDLGLVRTYCENIERELTEQGIQLTAVDTELTKIRRDVKRVLSLTTALKETFRDARFVEAAAEPVVIPARILLDEIPLSLPETPKGVEIRLEHTETETTLICVEPTTVADILRNLFVNAIDVMPNGGVVTLRLRSTARQVIYEVADTGPGIPKEKQPRIFELFYTTKESGFGFGLWSARRNALANRGELSVSSEPGQGSLFTLVLPRHPGTI